MSKVRSSPIMLIRFVPLEQFDAETEASELPWLITFCNPNDDTGTVILEFDFK